MHKNEYGIAFILCHFLCPLHDSIGDKTRRSVKGVAAHHSNYLQEVGESLRKSITFHKIWLISEKFVIILEIFQKKLESFRIGWKILKKIDRKSTPVFSWRENFSIMDKF